jgi:hypothetical protein
LISIYLAKATHLGEIQGGFFIERVTRRAIAAKLGQQKCKLQMNKIALRNGFNRIRLYALAQNSMSVFIINYD